MTMTSKERITVALQGGTPDTVPVNLGLSEIIPVQYTTNDYIEFFFKAKIQPWKVRTELEYDHFHADAYLHLGPEPSLDDPECVQTITKETSDEIFYTLSYKTKFGNLDADYFIGRTCPISVLNPFVKNPETDIIKVRELLLHPTTKRMDELNKAYDAIGDRAHVGFWLNTPIDWWVEMRGVQDMIMDLMLYPELMRDLFAEYTTYCTALVEHVFANSKLDSLALGGSSTSMSVISPTLHRKFSLPFGQALSKTAHQCGKIVQYHMCGKSRQALPITAEMGVDSFDALECAPTGDIDLAEVKRTYGAKFSLRGNINSIHIIGNGTVADVEREAVNCLNAAKAGGGYILAVGDQTPANTPEENLFAMVETGRRLGKY
jgi:uroporphyrinogen-III decarboxylase